MDKAGVCSPTEWIFDATVTAANDHRTVRRNSIGDAIERATREIAQRYHPVSKAPAKGFPSAGPCVCRTAAANDDCAIYIDGECHAVGGSAGQFSQRDHSVGCSPAKGLVTVGRQSGRTLSND